MLNGEMLFQHCSRMNVRVCFTKDRMRLLKVDQRNLPVKMTNIAYLPK